MKRLKYTHTIKNDLLLRANDPISNSDGSYIEKHIILIFMIYTYIFVNKYVISIKLTNCVKCLNIFYYIKVFI